MINENIFYVSEELTKEGREGKRLYDYVVQNKSNISGDEATTKMFLDYMYSIGFNRVQSLSYAFVDIIKTMKNNFGKLLKNNDPITENDFKFILLLFNGLCEDSYIEGNKFTSDDLAKMEINTLILRISDFLKNVKFVASFDTHIEYIIYMMRMICTLADVNNSFMLYNIKSSNIKKINDSPLFENGTILTREIYTKEKQEEIEKAKTIKFNIGINSKSKENGDKIFNSLKKIIRADDEKLKMKGGAYEIISNMVNNTLNPIQQQIVQTDLSDNGSMMLQNIGGQQLSNPIVQQTQQQSVTIPLKK